MRPFLLIPLLLLLPLVGCGTAIDPWDQDKDKIKVVASIPPLASFVMAIGKDRVAVRCLCSTTGPHHYQPDTREARVMNKADLLLAVGLRLDDTFADAMRTMARRGDLRFVKLASKIPSSTLIKFRHTHAPGEKHDHSHGEYDPHVWLGLKEAAILAQGIGDELGMIDKPNAAEYTANAKNLIERLEKLHAEGKKMLGEKKTNRIISFHEALGYFARSFELDVVDVIEQGPGSEPTAGHLAQIVKLCSDPDKPIGCITVEPQYPTSSSATIIQKELANKKITMPLVEIDPMETVDLGELEKDAGQWYENVMRKNLANLAKALQ